jgi:hypothetical protein
MRTFQAHLSAAVNKKRGVGLKPSFFQNSNSQRDGLHTGLFPRITNLIGEGLDLAIQADRVTAMNA